MTEINFGRLLYTDCRAGEGLGGGGGLQIQAKSANVEPAQARMAVSSLTYSIQSSWFAEGKSVEQYPLGFAHSAEVGFGTAESRYLGAGVNDPRPGNHLADCLLTTHPESYGSIRPAQLWLSDVWRDTPWPTTEAPVFDDLLDTGPLDNDSLAEWVAAIPQRAEVLLSLLTVLENADGPQVLIRSASPEAALRWIAAATILLPMKQALGISFRVFNNSRNEARFRALGLPADLVPPFTPGSRPGVFLLDDETLIADAVPASDRARFWVDLLVRAEEPYDVVSAVDIADALIPAGLSDPYKLADARVVAWSISDPDGEAIDADALGRWLYTASETAIDNYGAAVAGKLLADESVKAKNISVVDALVSDGRISLAGSQVRLALIKAEVREASASAAPLTNRLMGSPLSDADTSEAQALISSAMVLGSDREIGRLFGVVRRHRLKMSPISPALASRIHEFVAHWIESPRSFDYPAFNLPNSFLADEIHAQLVELLRDGNRKSFSTALPVFADALSGVGGDPEDEFSWQLEACLTKELSPDQRLRRVQDVLAGRRLAGFAESARLSAYQAALVEWRALDEESLLELVATLPPMFEIAPSILAAALKIVGARADIPTPSVLRAVVALDRRGALGPSGGQLGRLARSVTAMDTLIRNISPTAASAPNQRSLRKSLSALSRVPDDIVAAFLPQLTDAALGDRYALTGPGILKHLSPQAMRCFTDHWIKTQLGSPQPAQLGQTLALIQDAGVPEALRAELLESLVTALMVLPEADRTKLLDQIAAVAEKSWPEAWSWLKDALEPSKKRGSWRRGRNQ